MTEENNQKYYIGVDIGGTKTLVIVEDEKKEIFKTRTRTSCNVNEIIDNINKIIANLGIGENIAGMAVGVPGRVDSTQGIIIDAPALGWINLDMMAIFKKSFEFPVFIDNDVNLAIFSEKYRGGFAYSSNMFYISIGTGVGSSMIINNQLVRGSSYEAGEIGYFSNELDIRDGVLGESGEFGMFEKRISGTALNEKAKQIGLDSNSLFEEYYGGNTEVKKIIEDFTLHLSIVLSNVISLLNPEIVIIGGGVSTSMKGLLQYIKDTVAKITPIRSNIIISQFGNDSGALGAVEFSKRTN